MIQRHFYRKRERRHSSLLVQKTTVKLLKFFLDLVRISSTRFFVLFFFFFGRVSKRSDQVGTKVSLRYILFFILGLVNNCNYNCKDLFYNRCVQV